MLYAKCIFLATLIVGITASGGASSEEAKKGPKVTEKVFIFFLNYFKIHLFID